MNAIPATVVPFAARVIDAPGEGMRFSWPAGEPVTVHVRLFPASRASWDGKDLIVRTPHYVPSSIVNPIQDAIVSELARKRPVQLSLMYDGYPEDMLYFVVFAPADKLGRRFIKRLARLHAESVAVENAKLDIIEAHLKAESDQKPEGDEA